MGHVVAVAGEDADVVAEAVDLDARAVELPLDRCEPGAGERLVDIGGGAREHRQHRPEWFEADGGERLAPTGAGERGHPTEITVEHQRPPELGELHVARSGRGVGHEAFERALAQLTGEEPTDELAFVGGRPLEQRDEDRPAGRRRALTPRLLERVDREVEVGDGEARLRGRVDLDAGHRGPTDADASLPGRPGEEADDRRDLVERQTPEQLGERLDLRRARPGRRDRRSRSTRRRRTARALIVLT